MAAIVLRVLGIPLVQFALGFQALVLSWVGAKFFLEDTPVRAKVSKLVEDGTPGALENPFAPDLTPIIIGAIVGGALIFILAGRR